METSTAVYFKHGIGNLLLMLPAVELLAANDPSGKVDFCLYDQWRDSRRPAIDNLLSNYHIANNIINYPKDKIDKKYRRWFWTNHSEPSPVRDIFSSNYPGGLTVCNWTLEYKHETYYYIEQARLLGCKGIIPKVILPIGNITDELIGKKYVVLVNGTYDKKMKNGKQWPYFNQLATEILNWNNDIKIVTVGYGDELSDVNTEYNYVGKLQFCDSLAILKNAYLVISVDTALMHAADIMGVNLIAIFGGSLVSKNGPLSRSSVVVRKGLNCQPCQGTDSEFCRCEHNKCLKELTVGDVMNYVRTML